MGDTLLMVLLAVNIISLIAVAIRLERRLTKLETNQDWLINYIQNGGAV